MSSSVVGSRDRDCLACRLVSGFGLLGIGGYLAYHAKRNPTKAGKITIFSFALMFAAAGVARCGQLYPFNREKLNKINSSTN